MIMFLVNNLSAHSGPSANEPVKIGEDLGIRNYSSPIVM